MFLCHSTCLANPISSNQAIWNACKVILDRCQWEKIVQMSWYESLTHWVSQPICLHFTTSSQLTWLESITVPERHLFNSSSLWTCFTWRATPHWFLMQLHPLYSVSCWVWHCGLALIQYLQFHILVYGLLWMGFGSTNSCKYFSCLSVWKTHAVIDNVKSWAI